jgi:GT2 family glycosyltransferase
MNAAPWKIIHIDLQQPIPALQPEATVQGFYVVFWWASLPLDQIQLQMAQFPLTATQVKNLALKTIAPAVSTYLAKQAWHIPLLDSTLLPDRGLLPDLETLIKLESPLAQLQSPPISADSISVIICTRDRPEQLEKCLRSLRQSSQPPDEIIVVDNAPQSTATRDLIQTMPEVQYILESRPGLSVARNTGIAHATGQIIAFTDDDVTVHPDWLRQLQLGFRNSETMAVTGLVLPTELETDSQFIFEQCWSFNQGFQAKQFDANFFAKHRSKGVPVWTIGAGANMGFRRQIFDDIGLFDERLGAGAAGCSEDSEFWYRILAAGWQCAYEPSAVVYHTHRQSMASLNQQIYAYMRGHVAALLVQFENHRHLGNLRRVFLSLPKGYLKLYLSMLKNGVKPRHSTLNAEVSGCLSGLWSYFYKGLS